MDTHDHANNGANNNATAEGPGRGYPYLRGLAIEALS